MALVRFLDGEHASTTSTVDDELLTGGDGRYVFEDRHIASGSRRGTAYYLKQTNRSEWAEPDVPEWTAARDDDPAEDN